MKRCITRSAIAVAMFSIADKMMAFCHLAAPLLLAGLCWGWDFPFRDPTLSWEERVDDLVNRLTLEEMILQVREAS